MYAVRITAALGWLLAAALPALPAVSGAADIYHCIGSDGSAVFSEKPCGPDAELMSVEGHDRISGPRHPAPSPVEQLRNYRQNVREIENLVGAGEPPAKSPVAAKPEPCAHATSLHLRNARVGKRVVKCHRQDDVRAILGDPQSVYTWSDNNNYDTRWTYERGNDRQYVYFREGRVTRVDTRQDQ